MPSFIVVEMVDMDTVKSVDLNSCLQKLWWSNDSFFLDSWLYRMMDMFFSLFLKESKLRKGPLLYQNVLTFLRIDENLACALKYVCFFPLKLDQMMQLHLCMFFFQKNRAKNTSPNIPKWMVPFPSSFFGNQRNPPGWKIHLGSTVYVCG